MPSPAAHRPALDTLRFLAFFAVFMCHYDEKGWPYGQLGVPLFFALSGFLITRILVLHETADLRGDLYTFYARRTLRIFPLYYAVLLALLALGRLPGAAWYFTYTHNVWIYLTSGWTESTNHFWSLCVEEQFYLLYPLALLLTPARYRVGMLFALVAASVATRVALERPNTDDRSWALLPVAGEYLLWGCLAGMLELRLDDRERPWPLVAAVCVTVHALAAADQFSWHVVHPSGVSGVYQTAHGVAFSGLVLAVWRLKPGTLLALLTLPPITYLGRISYGLYVFHNFSYGLKARLVARVPALDVVPNFVVAMGATVAAAVLSWHLMEEPINRLKRYFPYRGRPSPQGDDVAAERLEAGRGDQVVALDAQPAGALDVQPRL